MQPEVWRLYAADDDALLAELTVHERDFPWIAARLAPTPAFTPLRPLFDEEARLVQAMESTSAWESAYDRVRAAVSLAGPDGVRVPEFLLHIEGDEAWWRYSDEPFDDEEV
jgi:hypothetical protein